MPNRIAVIGAHADDESFGALGTLLQHKSNGDEFSFMAFTESRGTRKGWDKTAQFFNARSRFMGFADQMLDIVPLVDLITPIEGFIKRTQPDIVYAPFIADLNADHRRVCEATMVACRPYKKFSPKEFWMYSIPGTTNLGFRPLISDKECHFIPEDKYKLLKEWYPGELINGRGIVNSVERFERWPR